MSLVRSLVVAMFRFNFVFYAIHVPGVENVLADALSHGQIGLFKHLQRQATERPSTILQHLLPGGLMADVKSILQRSLSPTTWSQYGKVWNEYESFARSILEIPAALPILPFQAVLFFALLHQKGLAASTIRSAGSVISFLHKLQGMPDTMGSFLVSKFLQGLSNSPIAHDVGLPITRTILYRMLRALSVMGFSLSKTALLWALYLTMFHGFFRVGEGTSKSSASLLIQYSDLAVNTQGAVVILRQFKHSKMLHRVELMRDKDAGICLVRALEDFIYLRRGVEGALFLTSDGKPYSTSTAREDLTSVLSFCGLDTKRYKSHSFRIGAASDAALRGFSDGQIRLIGQWCPHAFRQYIRLPY